MIWPKADTVDKEANVILITDACHSGKLTDKKFKGNFLAADQLRKVRNKEIRIMSSAANVLSNERPDWGGTRHKLVETYTRTYRFAEAVLQLDSLVQHKALNMEKQLLLAKFNMQDGRFADAEKLLHDAELVFPLFDAVLTSLTGTLAVKAHDTKKALEIYNGLYLLNHRDSIIL